MCLYVSEVKIAKEDIKCYKVVYKSGTCKYRSYFWKAPLSEINYAVKQCDFSKLTSYIPLGGEIIHAYCTLETAKNNLAIAMMGTIIVECIIPKNTHYVIGCNNDIGAPLMKIVREL